MWCSYMISWWFICLSVYLATDLSLILKKKKVMNIMKMIGTAISGATGLAALAISITNMVSKAKKEKE